MMIRKLGRYEIHEPIGEGAFGRVYRAVDPTIPRTVAIKELICTPDREILTRFRNEAAAAGNLDHSNIIRIYEYAEQNSRPYIAMEYLDGKDLQQIIKEELPLTLLEQMAVMSQVADGLHYAHLHGIIHRDVKPANIMVLARKPDEIGLPRAKVMDFGIARLTNAASLQLTRFGTFMGTPFYMAPEQFGEDETNHLCDVWAFGAVYYELLTGRVPFQAENQAALERKVKFEEMVPIRSLREDCPPVLESIIKRAMSKDRDLRYQSLDDLRLEAEPLLINLKRLRAATLLQSAEQLFSRGDWERAQPLVTEILSLDGGHGAANELRVNIEQSRRQRVLGPKLRKLIKAGEEAFNDYKFEEAVHLMELALDLESGDADAISAMTKFRSALNRSTRLQRLIGQAHCELQRNNLSAAQTILREILSLDPNEQDGALLQEQIRSQIELVNQKHWEKVLQQVDDYRSAGDFDSALRVLDAFDHEHPEFGPTRSHPEQLMIDIQILRDRLNECKEFSATVSQLTASLCFSAAFALIEQRQNSYPEEFDRLSSLLSSARREQRYHRAQNIHRTRATIRLLIAEGKFTEAKTSVQHSMIHYENDLLLRGLFETVAELEQTSERARHVSAALAEARELRLNGELDKALVLLNSVLGSIGDDVSVGSLLKQYQFEYQEQRYDEGLRAVLAEAARRVEKESALDAAAYLVEVNNQYPAEPELICMLEAARNMEAQHGGKRHQEEPFESGTYNPISDLQENKLAFQPFYRGDASRPGVPFLHSVALMQGSGVSASSPCIVTESSAIEDRVDEQEMIIDPNRINATVLYDTGEHDQFAREKLGQSAITSTIIERDIGQMFGEYASETSGRSPDWIGTQLLHLKSRLQHRVPITIESLPRNLVLGGAVACLLVAFGYFMPSSSRVSRTPSGTDFVRRAVTSIPPPRANEPIETARRELARGRDLDSKGDYKNAIEAFSLALRFQPNLVEALLQRGDTYRRMQLSANAIQDLSNAVKIRPDHFLAYQSLGLAWLNSKPPNYVAAIDAFGRATSLNRNLAYSWHGLAYAHFQSGDTKRALLEVDQSIRIDRRLRNAYVTRAQIKKRLGDLRGAEADRKEALLLAKSN